MLQKQQLSCGFFFSPNSQNYVEYKIYGKNNYNELEIDLVLKWIVTFQHLAMLFIQKLCL